MAETTEIIIDVQVDTNKVAERLAQATANVKTLKEEQKLLQKAFEEGRISNANYAKAIAQNKADIEQETRAIKSNTAILQAANIQTISNTQSLDEQRQMVNTLQKAYANLEGEEKTAADAEGGLRDQIKAATDSLKEQEAAIGDTRRNVGNYEEAIKGAFGELAHAGELMSPAIGLLRGMGGEGKKAAAALDVLQKVLQLTGEASKVVAASQEAQKAAAQGATVAQEGLNTAMKANPIGLIITGLSTLVPLIYNFVNAAGDSSKELAVLNGELERQSKIFDQLKADAQFAANLEGALGASAQEQIRILREAAVQTLAIADAEVDRLNDLILHGSKKERKAAQEALAEAVAAQEKAAAELNAINQRAIVQEATDRKKADDERKKAREERAKADRAAAIEQWDLERQTNEVLANILQERKEEVKSIALETLQELEEEEEELIPTPEEQAARLFGLDAEGVAYFKELLAAGIDASQAAAMAMNDQWSRNARNISQVMANIGASFSAVGDLLGNFSEQSEGAAKAQKAFGLIGILTSEAASIAQGALAISEGIASAASIPFPGNIPAIASVTATIAGMLVGVASSISQAKSLFEQTDSIQAFSHGGEVKGNSYSGDRVLARLNSKEGVLTATGMNNVKDIVRGLDNGTLGINYDLLGAAMVAAVEALPAPVMDYTEFKTFEQNVATLNEIAKL